MAIATPAAAQTAPTPDTIVSVCSGVSLPPSVVTGIIDPVLTGIYDPIETQLNGILGSLTNPLLGIVGLPGPLNVDVNGLLTQAGNGQNIGLNVIASDGTLVGPGDPCNAQADSFTLANPAGISIGGNAITGLGSTGDQAVAGEIDSIALGNRAATDAAAVGSIAIGTDAEVGAGGTGSIAFGAGSNVTVANSVALGAGSIASRGPQAGSVGEVSVGAPGAERQITNVAAGTSPTDAVNGAQLGATNQQVSTNTTDIANLQTSVGNLQTTVGTNTTAITNLQTNVAANTTAITNLQGGVTANTTAITNLQTSVGSNTTAITNLQTNVGSLQTDVTNLQTTVNNISTGNAGPVRYSNAATPTTPNGGTPTNDVTLVGAAPGPVGLHNVAAGSVAAGSTDAVNGGQLFTTNASVATAQQTANQALALGQNAVTYDSSARTSVTLGSTATPVQLRNVAAGTLGTDAVNLNQVRVLADDALRNANAYTDQRISELDFDLRSSRKEARAGSAAALAAAGMPQAMDPGKSMISGGVGTYRGRTALAIGASHRVQNGQAVFRLGVTYDSSEHVGANGGVGFQF